MAGQREPASATSSAFEVWKQTPVTSTSLLCLTRHVGGGWKTFKPRYVLGRTSLLMRKVAPSLGEEGGGVQAPGSEWRRSKFGGVVLLLVCAGATECDESKYLSCLQRCRMVDSCPTSWSSPTAETAALLKGSNKPESTLLLLCPSRSPGRTFLFSTHSLRVLSTPLPPSGCRVSLSSCHTGPPTLTHGGREGERN